MSRLPSSFRDPSGFLFERDGVLHRQVNASYAATYDRLSERDGLFDELIAQRLLIPHEEVEVSPAEPSQAHRVLRPERIPFVSYPYEWSFSQLQDAARLTLDVQKRALKRGFTLKDASAFNVQFIGCRPIFIDTLSFELYEEGRPWTAYRQFCQHFLGPLALHAGVDPRLMSLFRTSIDGIDLDLTSRLLPRRSWLRFGLLSHIHLHARAQRRHAGRGEATAKRIRSMPRNRLIALLENLESTVKGLRWSPPASEWGDYYDETNYSDEAMQAKLRLVTELSRIDRNRTILDLGANTGLFTRNALDAGEGAPAGEDWGAYGIACDIDRVAVEKNYLQGRAVGEEHLLPMVMDLTNPSPGIGWHHSERDSLVDRASADLVMALALIHHLAISNNVPLDVLADFFASLARRLIIEFIPKSDSQVQRLLATREDVFPNYDRAEFERVFERRFSIERAEEVPQSDRTLYLMHLRDPATERG